MLVAVKAKLCMSWMAQEHLIHQPLPPLLGKLRIFGERWVALVYLRQCEIRQCTVDFVS